MYFTSNHDENSWNGSEFERMGANHKPAFILSATAQSSMPLLYTGQEVSMKKRLRFFEKDTVDWTGPSLADFYRSVFDLKHTQAALANGPWGGPQTKLDDRWRGWRVRVHAHAGCEHRGGGGQLRLKPAAAVYRGLTRPGSYTDWFTKQPVTLAGSGRIDDSGEWLPRLSPVGPAETALVNHRGRRGQRSAADAR